MKTKVTTGKTEHELNLYYKQLEALEESPEHIISNDEKNILRGYYQKQIKNRLKILQESLTAAAETAYKINT